MTSVTSNDLSEPLWSQMASVVSNGLSDLKRPQIGQVSSKLYTQICVDSTGALHFYRATSYLIIRSTVICTILRFFEMFLALDSSFKTYLDEISIFSVFRRCCKHKLHMAAICLFTYDI